MNKRAGDFWTGTDESEALRRYRTLVNTVDDGIYQLDAEGRFVAVNETIAEMVGYDREDLVGEHVSTLLDDAEIERIEREIRRRLAAEDGDEDTRNDTIEFRIRTIDGETIVCELQLNVLVDDGEFQGTVGVVREITERKRTEEQLREREQQLQRERNLTEKLVETSPVGVLVLDADGAVTRMNERCQELLAIDDPDSYAPSERPTYDESGTPLSVDEHPFARALRTGSPVYDELVQVELPDGDRRWLSVSAAPITDEDGEIDRVVTTGEDVTELKERERELERERDDLAAKLEEIYGRITDGFIAVNEDWELTHVNERAEEILDVDEGDLLGEMVWDHPEVTDIVFEERYREAMATQEPVSFVGDLPETDTGAWYEQHVYPSETGLSVYFRDVTERKEMERELRESKERFQRIAEHIEEVIWLTPPDKAEMTYVNPAYEEIWGRSRESLYEEPTSFLDSIHPDDRERVRDALDQQPEGEYDETYRVVTPDDEIRWVRDRAFPIEDGAGNVFQIVGIAEDVTERKERKRDLELFRTLLDHSNDAVFVEDPETGAILDVNDTATRHLGYSRDELLELAVPDIDVELPTAADYREFVEEVKAEGQTTFHGTQRRKDGSTFPVEVNLSYVELGEAAYVLAISRDITERRERERRYRTLVENFPNGAVALFDENLEYQAVGGAILDEIGTSPEEVVGATVWDRYPEPLDEKMARNFRSALDGEPRDFEFELHDRHWYAHTVPVEDDDGHVSAGMILVQDITDRKEMDRDLRESEAKFRMVAENLNEIVWMATPNTEEFLYVNPTYEDIFGQDRDVLYEDASAFAERLHPDDRERVLEEWNRLPDEPYEEEFRVVRPDGDIRWVKAKATRVHDETGDVTRVVGFANDVTERKRREHELRDAKSQLEAAIEAGAVGTWEWHVPEDRFVTGAAFARTFGVDPEAAQEGVSIDRLVSSIHEDDRDRIEGAIGEALETCGEYEEEYRVWNADGECRWVLARGHVDCDEAGNPLTFPGTLVDITERKRAEKELQRTTDQLETLFDVLPVGVVVANADGSLRRANDVAREIWGGDVFDVDSVAEYEKYEAVWAETGEPVEPEEWTMAQVLRGEEVAEPNIYEIETFDGKERIIMEHGMPVCDDRGNVTRAVVTLTDITERREYQRKLEESNERLEQFAYAASHDLQEPLRMISSYLQLLERRYGDDLDEDAEEFIDYAVDGADRMREMIEGLLEYSRIETQGEPFEPVALETVFEDVRTDLQFHIEESGAEITAEPLPTVEGDEEQLRQLFQNLLDNAIEYSGDEPPRVHVGAERNGSEWIVSVRDEGIGIEPDEQERIFEVFQRLHSREDHTGTGIGLALCERVVERHGGELWVDSEPGEGSTFSFTLPVMDDETD